MQNTPNIVQIEQASVSGKPVRPQPVNNTLLASALGFLLAAGIAFLVEYMDDTLRSPDDVEQVLGLPILGYVSEMRKVADTRQLFVAAYPRSPVAEAFRSLRSNIDFSGAERPLKTILVTSSRAGEGKTTVASNLAASFAQSGKRVILVDADLRRPSVHRAMDVPNRAGLATLFRDSLKPADVWKNWGVSSRGMFVITSGALPSNPAELLGSEKMLHILAELRKTADIIIIDSPPVMVADAQILSSLVDGVVLVLRPGKSPADEARSTLTLLKRSGANLIGVVFNRIPKNGNRHYGGYRYYAPNAYHNYYQQEKPGQSVQIYNEASVGHMEMASLPQMQLNGERRNGNGHSHTRNG